MSQAIYPFATTTDWIKVKEVSLQTNTYPLSVTGLNLRADLAYFVIAYIGNSHTQYSRDIDVVFNGDTNTSNYTKRAMIFEADTVTSYVSSSVHVTYIGPGKFTTIYLYIAIQDGYVTANVLPCASIVGVTSPPITWMATLYHNTATNLTGLQFYIGINANSLTNLLAGSKALVFKPRLG